MLLDSNIIIYAAQPKYAELRRFIAEHTPAVSAVSYVEVLGYHHLTEPDRIALEAFFAESTILPITQEVMARAVKLRQSRKMTLGDSLIAGTALAFARTLVTRNVKDFEWISALKIHNPIADG